MLAQTLNKIDNLAAAIRIAATEPNSAEFGAATEFVENYDDAEVAYALFCAPNDATTQLVALKLAEPAMTPERILAWLASGSLAEAGFVQKQGYAVAARMIHRMFPHTWPSAFADISPETIGLDAWNQILYYLTDLLTDRDVDHDAQAQNTMVKDAMRATVVPDIVSTWIAALPTDPSGVLRTAAGFAPWIDAGLLLDAHDPNGFLAQLLALRWEVPEALQVMTALISKGMEYDLKIQVAEMLHVEDLPALVPHHGFAAAKTASKAATIFAEDTPAPVVEALLAGLALEETADALSLMEGISALVTAGVYASELAHAFCARIRYNGSAAELAAEPRPEDDSYGFLALRHALMEQLETLYRKFPEGVASIAASMPADEAALFVILRLAAVDLTPVCGPAGSLLAALLAMEEPLSPSVLVHVHRLGVVYAAQDAGAVVPVLEALFDGRGLAAEDKEVRESAAKALNNVTKSVTHDAHGAMLLAILPYMDPAGAEMELGWNARIELFEAAVPLLETLNDPDASVAVAAPIVEAMNNAMDENMARNALAAAATVGVHADPGNMLTAGVNLMVHHPEWDIRPRYMALLHSLLFSDPHMVLSAMNASLSAFISGIKSTTDALALLAFLRRTASQVGPQAVEAAMGGSLGDFISYVWTVPDNRDETEQLQNAVHSLVHKLSAVAG